MLNCETCSRHNCNACKNNLNHFTKPNDTFIPERDLYVITDGSCYDSIPQSFTFTCRDGFIVNGCKFKFDADGIVRWESI